MKKYLLTLLLPVLCSAPLLAQDVEDETSAFEDEPEYSVPARDEVTITLNQQPFVLGEEVTLEKDKVMDIHIQYLKPHSKVHLEVSKAGKVLSRMSWDANEKGELLLQTATGRSNVGGQARIRYTTSSGKMLERQVKVMVR